jgi:DUF218 domain-containing protein
VKVSSLEANPGHCGTSEFSGRLAMDLRVEQPVPSGSHSTRRLWGLVTRRERWGLSWRGWLAMAGVAMALGCGLLFGLHRFLAVTHPVDAQFLVIEGWIDRYAIRAGLDEFKRGHYQRLFTTGGPENGSGGYVNDAQTAAGVSAALLKRLGLADELVQTVPSHVIGRDRTYHSALALRQWLRAQNLSVHRLNVLTEDAHGRRTRMLFQKVFGDECEIGIISVPNPDYDAKHWWLYSEGVREVLGETIAYVYARCLFHPGRSEDAEFTSSNRPAGLEPAQPLQLPQEGR